MDQLLVRELRAGHRVAGLRPERLGQDQLADVMQQRRDRELVSLPEARGFELQDHALSLSLYFNDRDGNPIELTTYEVDLVRARTNRI